MRSMSGVSGSNDLRWKCYKYQSLSGVQMVQFGSHSLHTVDEVYDFTIAREEQIRLVEEEIEMLVNEDAGRMTISRPCVATHPGPRTSSLG